MAELDQQIPSNIDRPKPKPSFDRKGDSTKGAKPRKAVRPKPLPAPQSR